MNNFWEWFGDIGTWFAGIATFMAVAAAIFYSHRQDRRETEQSLQNVYAWMQMAANGRWQIVVNNGTGAPINDWIVTIKWDVQGEEVFDNHSEEDLGIIPPGQKSWPLLPEASRLLPIIDSKIRVSIEFVDRNGQRWLRDESNALISRQKGGSKS